MKGMSCDADGATVSFCRSAENLTVRQRRVLRVYGDRAPDRLWATGDGGHNLRVGQLNLVGFHMDGAAIAQPRCCGERTSFTGEITPAIDENRAAISVREWREVGQRRVIAVVCIEDCAIGKTHGLRPRQTDRAARENAPTSHVERTTSY